MATSCVLSEYLSPEVQQFAIAIETAIRQNYQPSEEKDTRPRVLWGALSRRVEKLRETLSRRGVTDLLMRTLPKNHLDYNPKHVREVFLEAVQIALCTLKIAEICGALDSDLTTGNEE